MSLRSTRKANCRERICAEEKDLYMERKEGGPVGEEGIGAVCLRCGHVGVGRRGISAARGATAAAEWKEGWVAPIRAPIGGRQSEGEHFEKRRLTREKEKK